MCSSDICSKDHEIVSLQQKGEDDANEIAALKRRIRELQTKIEELEEDLDNEKKLRSRVSYINTHYKYECLDLYFMWGFIS